MMSDFERMIHQLNAKSFSAPYSKPGHWYFEEQVKRTPNAIAIETGKGNQLSYQVLNRRANRLAHYLTEAHVKIGDVVAILQPRSVKFVVSLLAIMKAGGCVVILEPGYPREYIHRIIDETKCKHVLVHLSMTERFGLLAVNCHVVDKVFTKKLKNYSASNLDLPLTWERPLHIIYTSGSTGKPKGVIRSDQTTVNWIHYYDLLLPIQPDEAIVLVAGLSRPSLLRNVMMPLLFGATLYILQEKVLRNPQQLIPALSQIPVRRMATTPGKLKQWLLLNQKMNISDLLKHIELWWNSADILPTELVQQFRDIFPHTRFLNVFGGSEFVGAIHYDIPSIIDPESKIPLGKPSQLSNVYILDDQLHLVAPGEVGEIYVSGVNIALGYVDNPSLTAERFIRDPFVEDNHVQMYRTGDLGTYLPDGNIVFNGRDDHQIKVRGFTVHLTEVETAIETHPAVQAVAVMPGMQGSTGQYRSLKAYLELLEPITVLDLRQYLYDKLPEYMIPAQCFSVENLPRLVSGKKNRQILNQYEDEIIPQS